MLHNLAENVQDLVKINQEMNVLNVMALENVMNNSMSMSTYQQFIHKSRYARWQDELGRRETWEETIARYVAFMKASIPNKNVMKKLDEASVYMLNMDVMPSMRSLMTAGEAARRENLAMFNCSYLSVSDARAFDEILYVLMNGTGVGFSVERQYVSKLPEVAPHFHETDTTLVVHDSKIGWAKAYRELIQLLFIGQVPRWDVSSVRPAGSRLKTFGGRASGPEPLVALFKFTVEMFKKAAGRKLSSIECHDIVCKIAEVVVVGGVRRSALISLSNLSDDRMRAAKTGQWWIDNPQRALANNSAVYSEQPDLGVFLKEWESLYESKSGERGIISRMAYNNKAAAFGKREAYEHGFGSNPCFAPGTLIPTKNGLFKIEDLVGKEVEVWDGNAWRTIDNFRITGENMPVYTIKLQDGSTITTTAYHTFVLEDGQKVEMKDLEEGDRLAISIPPDTTYTIKELTYNVKPKWNTIVSIEYAGVSEKVYCCTVPDTHTIATGVGILTGQCGEIILRSNQLCNLTEIVVRPKDTYASLKKKAEIASFLGTLQASFTSFKYVRDVWKNNTEEEALLGVSITGVFDNPLTYSVSDTTRSRLNELRKTVVETNARWASTIGIAASAATTCVKPSGTVSQLVDCASGLHPRYADYYVRRVRQDIKDPLTQLLIESGVVHEQDKMNPSAMVFSFPMKAPAGCVTTHQLDPLYHYSVWQMYRDFWCEHNPSVTISYRDKDFLALGAKVWAEFDKVGGISFLPLTDHIYEQAPYEQLSKEQYQALCAANPAVDFNKLSKFESEDSTVFGKELACTAGQCEL